MSNVGGVKPQLEREVLKTLIYWY